MDHPVYLEVSIVMEVPPVLIHFHGIQPLECPIHGNPHVDSPVDLHPRKKPFLTSFYLGLSSKYSKDQIVVLNAPCFNALHVVLDSLGLSILTVS